VIPQKEKGGTTMLSQIMKTLGPASVLALAAWAQSDSPARFNIPFDFSVGEEHLGAGKYEVVASPASPIIRIRNGDGDTVWMGITQALTASRVTEVNRLVFNKYGDRYFVSKILVAGTDGGRQIFPSRQERELARNASKANATLTAAKRSNQ
jgi:hypothetical protein